MLGHGRLITRYPPLFVGTDLPSMSTTSASIPKNGKVAVPGLVGIAPGSGAIIVAPVSVCHHVSTIGQRFLPMTSRYHIHASGLMGSPTVPNKRNESSLRALGNASPAFINARIAV